ncbi:MAG TPA: acetate--CoA ligase family protein [Parafilimonas sp.]|nr:acetate--CoA ligase family protein [Parafilimonas sp.]
MLENEIYEWLQSYQIATPQYKVFKLNKELKVDFYPVALKLLSNKVVHKTEVGAVVININDDAALKKAKREMLCNLCKQNIHVDENDKLIVTKMYTGIELFFGIVNDACFGKVIVFGAGGIFTELFKDICFIDSEAGDDELKSAIAQTKISALFTKGFRGKKYNIELVVEMIKKLQQLDVEEMDLNPVILSENTLTVVDARLKQAQSNSVSKHIKYIPQIFSPKKIAIIGVSEHEEKIGYALAKNASAHDGVYFVNPHLKNLFGKKVYNNINELPDVDTAVLAIPVDNITEVIQQLAEKKVQHVIIITAGFKEAGRDESFLKELSEKFQINIIGPNCIGIYTNGINLTFGTNDIQTGKTNLFSQSGAIVAEVRDKAALQNIGFENIISVGNMVDVDFADLINSYPGNNPINLYVEGISNGKNLLRAIRKSKSHIRIFKAGKTEVARKAAFSHTGNMAGNYEMFVGLLRAAGAEILNDVNGLLYPYNFKKILVITNAGGAGTIMSDLISDKLYKLNTDEIAKLSEVLPKHWSKNNPIDIIGDACYDRYSKALQVADNFNVDAIYVLITPQFMTNPKSICKLFVENNFNTKLFPVLLGGEMMQAAKSYLEENKINYFEELNEAVSFL